LCAIRLQGRKSETPRENEIFLGIPSEIELKDIKIEQSIFKDKKKSNIHHYFYLRKKQ